MDSKDWISMLLSDLKAGLKTKFSDERRDDWFLYRRDWVFRATEGEILRFWVEEYC
jgi:hypothetical protein